MGFGELFNFDGRVLGVVLSNIKPKLRRYLLCVDSCRDAPGEVFVFGSNIRGAHMGGAARVAMEKFGAVWGVGEGLQGQSYALPTMEGLQNIGPAVQRFTAFAREHPELRFLVTPVGCGIAGYTPEEIAPLFREASALPNVCLPESFWEALQI